MFCCSYLYAYLYDADDGCVLCLIAFYYRNKKHKRVFARVFLSGMVVGISYLLWLIVLRRQFAVKTKYLSDLTEAEANIDAIDVICKGLNEWFADFFNPNPLIWILGLVLSLVLGYVLVEYARKTKEYMWNIHLQYYCIGAWGNVVSC